MLDVKIQKNHKEKHPMIASIKKIFAFILDLFVLIIVYYVLALIILFGIGMTLGKNAALKFESIFDTPFRLVLLISYFVFLPKKIGNTFGRKILNIKDKFNLFWTWPFLREKGYPQKHLKKDEIIKIIVKNGQWICPSCNESNLEIFDVCSACGQEIEKITQNI